MKIKYLLIVPIIFCLNVSVFSWDSDGDGIPNKYDECKKKKEDKDNFEDTDGCPDPDNDKDGILDKPDKCPLVPEDKDGFEDEDGCPDPDNDKDGIPDTKDKCPNKPEDFDSFQDMDGCPDPDNDKDGLLDGKDKCPNDPEDKDGFEDENGCPDYDNDKDGIKDEADKCPNQAETFNDKDDEDGCPDVGIPPLQDSQVFPFIQFRTGTDELTFESNRPLDSIIIKMKAYPDKQIKILIFKLMAESVEKSLEVLTAQHAAIVKYLTNGGISPDRIASADFSVEAYEAVKETESDFLQKRPVEVHITKFDPNAVKAPADSSTAP